MGATNNNQCKHVLLLLLSNRQNIEAPGAADLVRNHLLLLSKESFVAVYSVRNHSLNHFLLSEQAAFSLFIVGHLSASGQIVSRCSNPLFSSLCCRKEEV